MLHVLPESAYNCQRARAVKCQCTVLQAVTLGSKELTTFVSTSKMWHLTKSFILNTHDGNVEINVCAGIEPSFSVHTFNLQASILSKVIPYHSLI